MSEPASTSSAPTSAQLHTVKLETARQVMQAFLAGHRLRHRTYGGGGNPDYWLYLSEGGEICEEDGAGAKTDRVPMARCYERGWEILPPSREDAK